MTHIRVVFTDSNGATVWSEILKVHPGLIASQSAMTPIKATFELVEPLSAVELPPFRKD
jgi:hypothetical protein